MSRKKINILGNILVILSCAFIIRMIVVSDVDMQMLFTKTALPMLVALTILYAGFVLSLAGMFRVLLKAFHGADVPCRLTLSIYCKSNIYKYLPGNIFHYVGRNQLAVQTDIKHTEVVSATITEIFFILFAGIFLSVTLTGRYAVDWIGEGHLHVDHTVVILLLVLMILALTLTLIFSEKARKALYQYSLNLKYLGIKKVLAIQGMYLGLNLFNGILFLGLLYGLGGGLVAGYAVPVIGMFAFSWLVGYVTPGASAGLGVREAVMVALLAGIISMNIIVTAVIAFRIVTVLGDILAYIATRQTKRGENV